MKIPQTPFSTRLSGSAKETELRLRSIFQWKKKRPPVILFILTAVLVLLCCGLVSCQEGEPNTSDLPVDDSGIEEEKLPPSSDDIPIAPLQGEAVSPDGSYKIVLSGRVDGVLSGGVVPPESVQLVSLSNDVVLWECDGLYEHAAIWSPGSNYLVLARTARTWCTVTVIDTKTRTSWDVRLPDGSAIPEYTFLPDDWCAWVDENTFLLTVGRGGEVDQNTYRCSLVVKNDALAGSSVLQETKTLPGEYDFNHDGAPETVDLVSVWGPDWYHAVSWFELQVRAQDGSLLWSETAGPAHMVWNSLFACTLDGEDYLLRYHPTMYQGSGGYSYQVFSLSPDGEEVVFQENGVSFDLNFNSPLFTGFDGSAVADFMDDVNAMLSHSKRLFSTDGELTDIDPEQPYHDPSWLHNTHWGYTYDESKTMRENLLALEQEAGNH